MSFFHIAMLLYVERSVFYSLLLTMFLSLSADTYVVKKFKVVHRALNIEFIKRTTSSYAQFAALGSILHFRLLVANKSSTRRDEQGVRKRLLSLMFKVVLRKWIATLTWWDASYVSMTRMGKGFKKFKSLWLCTSILPLLLLTQNGTQKLTA